MSRLACMGRIAGLAALSVVTGVVIVACIPRQSTPAARAADFPRLPLLRSSLQQQVPRAESVHVEHAGSDELPFPIPPELAGINLMQQSAEEAGAKSWGCVECHRTVHDPHFSTALNLGCVDCHGGNAQTTEKCEAHVAARFPDAWTSSGNPVRSYALLNHERPEFIRFVNPGDLRIAHLSCGTMGCHEQETLAVKKSMMTHGCMLWGAALYNNGSVPFKQPRYGESYSMHGKPQRLQTVPPPTAWEMEHKGVVPFLDPLPRFQTTHPGNVLRIFERGGRFLQEVGIPERLEEPGRPRMRLSTRGLGTLNRTDPVFVSLAKTRLLDPTLNFLGTNDHPGDYRSSGCTACHVVYANDRSVIHSGPFAKYGNGGTVAPGIDGFVTTSDPTIPRDEPGHPIEHRFTRAIPTSQCIICHVHPGTSTMNSYLGYMWWDQETDGEYMYPMLQKDPSAEELAQAQMLNPNDIAARGNWSDPAFLNNITDLNSRLQHTQFADFHGHGWVFKAVYKKDREGNLLNHQGEVLEQVSNPQLQKAMKYPEKVKELYRHRSWTDDDQRELEAQLAGLQERYRDAPVHMLDIHLERGMHCVDCHFVQDVHGDAKLYGEVRAAIEIRCEDCHGTAERPAYVANSGNYELRTSGPAAAVRTLTDAYGHSEEVTGRNLAAMRTPFGKRRFELREGKLIQHSMVEEEMSWKVTQVADTVDPQHAEYNPLSALAKTVRFDAEGTIVWGSLPNDPNQCAHSGQQMSCIACHSSWNTTCYGCHLSQKADKKRPELHFEGDITQNYVSYNFQTLRDDVFMLARDGIVTGNRINPSRSSCAIHVGSYNKNRESIYVQQQTISAEGMSGISFSTNVPHTVRGRGETKMCSDCHLSQANDNNALIAQLVMQGTNALNFIGRYCWVAAGDHGLWGVVATEREEPQSVIGSTHHRLAYPTYFHEHVERGRLLDEAHEHPGNDISDNVFNRDIVVEIKSVQLRGEYVYAACGEAGMRIFDVAFIDNKAFSERITTAPVSPIGQRFYVRTCNATDVAAPATIAPDPTRTHLPENHEATVHPLYAYLYVTDLEEGLILVGAGTLLDGNPNNNFVERELTFNPEGLLNGAQSVTIVGTYAYVCCEAGVAVISLDDPKHPEVTSVLGGDFVHAPKAVEFQFRYGFVCDEEGIKVIDVTDLALPKPVTSLALPHVHNIYVARTYAYVAAGEMGLVILDITNPEEPRVDQVYDAGGAINDLHDVKLGITYVSQFAYLADGVNGMRIVQLTSPETPGNAGFNPRPTPELIATFPIPHGGHALAISEGVDRDRAVDESGNQIAVFGRIGARPLNREEQERLYLHPQTRQPWYVPEFRRDYGIASPQRREIDLFLQVTDQFPDYRGKLPPRPAESGQATSARREMPSR